MATYSDDFAGTGALGANWVHVVGSGLSRSSDKLVGTATWSVARYSGGVLATDNQFVQVTISSSGWSNSDNSHQILARMHNSAAPSSNLDWYAAVTNTQGNPAVYAQRGCYEYLAASYSSLGYDSGSGVLNAGDVMLLRIEGVMLLTYKNGTLLPNFPWFNKTILPDANHRSAGISLAVTSGDTSFIKLDDWSAGDIVTPTYAPSDDLNRADSSDIGLLWASCDGASNLIISGNAARSSILGAVCAEYWTGWAPQADQWSEVTVKKRIGGVGNGLGPAVRVGLSGTSTFYYIWASQDVFEIWKIITGGPSPVHTGNTTNVVPGDVIRLEVEGITLRAKLNGTTLITTTDSSIATGFWGMYSYNSSSDATSNCEIDAWAGGEITAAAGGGYPWHTYSTLMGA